MYLRVKRAFTHRLLDYLIDFVHALYVFSFHDVVLCDAVGSFKAPIRTFSTPARPLLLHYLLNIFQQNVVSWIVASLSSAFFLVGHPCLWCGAPRSPPVPPVVIIMLYISPPERRRGSI
jgi:hypothetical protein